MAAREVPVEIGLLGAFEVRVGGREVVLTATQQRAVLATLACAAPDPVATEDLVGVLWGERPPSTARTALHNAVRRLRTRFAEAGASDVVATAPEGYRLAGSPEQVDAVRWRVLVERARAAQGEPEEAASAYASALELWRGEPAPDLPREGRLGRDLERLDDDRCAVTEEWAEAEVRAGRPERPVAALRSLVESRPLHEPLRARLVLVLHAAGRTADALSEYAAARRVLVDELGVEPGAALRHAHRAALRPAADAGEDEETADRTASGPLVAVVVPAQLPHQAGGLHGRDEHVAALDAARSRGRAGALVVSGPAGVGKTALAVHWARRVASDFPDGQLFADLRGFDPDGAPLTNHGVLRGFLTALGVPTSELPSEPEQMLGLYRSLLAGRRVLVVLDNARDPAQVRPLLPSADGSLAVVTSRHELGALAVTHRVESCSLTPLGRDEARAVLVDALGEERARSEPESVAEVLAACGGLPLALSVAAAQLAAHPALPVSALAERLRLAASPLDVLRLDDPVADVRAVLSWSVRALRPEDARAFALLGLHPSSEAGLASVAGLLAVGSGDARASLDRLVATHLASAPAPDRVRLHDLVRAHAVEVADGLAETVRSAAIARVVDHYLHSAVAATRQHFATPLPFRLVDPVPDAGPETFDDVPSAARWLDRELSALVRVVDVAASRPDLQDRAWRLARVLNGWLWDRCQWHEMRHMHTASLAAALAAGDRTGEADSRHGLADALVGLDDLPKAYVELDRARAVFADLGDGVGEGDVLTTQARALESEGRFAEALAASEAALEICVRTGDRGGQAVATNNVAWILMQLGHHADAVVRAREAADLYRDLDDHSGLTYALDTLGQSLLSAGEPEAALPHLAESTELSRRQGQALNLALNQEHLGDAYRRLGDRAAARAAWESAEAILDGLGHEAAERLRERLAGVDELGSPA